MDLIVQTWKSDIQRSSGGLEEVQSETRGLRKLRVPALMEWVSSDHEISAGTAKALRKTA